MNSAEKAIYKLLANCSQVTALVAERISPELGESKDIMPYITYNLISEERDHVLDGVGGMSKARMQLNCWSGSYTSTVELKNAVVEEYNKSDETGGIDGFSGSIDDLIIQCVHVNDISDIFDYTEGTDKSKRYGKRIDIQLWYNL